VRGPEGRVADQHPVGQRASGGGVHLGHRQRLFGRQRGQQAGQALGQHGLARARRTHHQEVVPPGRRHLEHVAAQGLSPDIGQIGDLGRRRGGLRRWDGRPVGPGAQDLRQLGQRGHPVRGVAPDQRGLPGIAERHDQLERCRGIRQGDHARDMAQRAVEAELATECERARAVRGKLARGHQHPHGDGQVQTGASLTHPRGSQVHRDPAQRPGQPTREESRPHAVARLAHGGLGQTHDGETGQAVGDMDLHRDRLAQGAGQGRRRDTSEHAEERSPSRRLLPGHIRP
jgi:hypothetical protein